jgi:arabinofuranosyltransferase
VPRRSTRYYALLTLLILLAGLGLYLGWRLFWFLTDDAYIAFRYISNSQLGYGYVWNAPPFKPVEGYTSFLWVVLLDVIWRVTGIEPPDSANVVSLIFAGGTLLIISAMVLRLRLAPALERYRLAFLALVLIGTLTNRTFLAWTSSGLETAMFNFWLTAWVFVAISLPPDNLGRLSLLAGLAALMEMTRPDGLLFIAATITLIAIDFWNRLRREKFQASQLIAFVPFLFSALHLIWRRLMYGAWLPNTYAAKYTGPWPESGVRYLLSFIIEYSLWFWLALAGLFCLLALRRLQPLALVRRWLNERPQSELTQIIVVGALAAHFAYYTFIIGGDHFEYRVYSQLVPLLLVSFVWLVNALAMRPALALSLTILSLAAALPIPWTHWALSQQRTTRLESWIMRVPVAPHFPGLLRPYVQVFDDLQDWLIQRAVGVRHQEHKIFSQYQASLSPTRAAGLLLSPEAQAVRAEGTVGVVSWVLPTIAIVDASGLDDSIVAHNPHDPNGPRLMAHDRIPPEGYLECFQPNVTTPLNKFIVAQRTKDLNSLAPTCQDHTWPVTRWSPDAPNPNLALAPTAARVLDNVWTQDPLFIYYVPPQQAPAQSASALWTAFNQNFHDTGCLVFAPAGHSDDYDFAFLPPNLRYAPDELRTFFPWAGIVDFERIGEPEPYNVAYAFPASDGTTPLPATAHKVKWAPASLLGFDLPTAELQAGGLLETTLYFRTHQAASTEQWFRLSLVAAAQPDAPLALDQGDPCRGLYPASLWQPNQTIITKSVFVVPPDLPPGDYALRVSLFDLQSGPDQPLPAQGDATLAAISISAH